MLDRMALRPLPFSPFHVARRSFDAALHEAVLEAFGRPAARGAEVRSGVRSGGLFPGLELARDDAGWTLSADLPGWRPEEVTVTFEEGVLTLAGERVGTPEGWDVVRRERAGAAFKRSVRFAEPVDDAHIDATLRDGVLTITVPRHARPAPRAIEVKA